MQTSTTPRDHQEDARSGTPFSIMDNYPYKPLRSGTECFRLLYVDPGSGTDPVKCRLQPASLDKDSGALYETVSYVWGEANLRAIVHIDDCSVSIPHSAERALYTLRLADRERCLWIDAVCINQNDIDERSQQVSKMARIYSQSQCNLIILGGSEQMAQVVLQDLDTILNDMLRYKGELRASFNTENLALAALIHQDVLIQFFSLPWFRRLWVVQEAALAPKNLCFSGGMTFDLLDVIRSAAWLIHSPNPDLDMLFRSPGLYNATMMYTLVDHEHKVHPVDLQRLDLTFMLELGSYFAATDARDHVFGLLGLQSLRPAPSGNRLSDDPQAAQLIQPNYRSLLPQVLCNAMRFAIAERETLDVLVCIRHPPSGLDSSWPSWAARIDQSAASATDPYATRGLPDWFCASGSLLAERSSILSLGAAGYGILSLRGVSADEVLELSEPVDFNPMADMSDGEAAQLLTTMFAKIEVLAKRYGASSPHGYRTFISTMIAETNDVNRHVCREELDDLMEQLSSSAVADIPAKYQRWLWAWCRNRCFFVTVSGRFGLGPWIMQRGDTVAVFHGGGHPYIVRPARDGMYQLIGPAYVNGLMYGEAFRQQLKSNTEIRTMDIC